LYAQEEIEIARATGERLLDSRASAEMARRLMALERQRLAESQVLDHNARRVLHDDVLPRLHAVMLRLDRDRASPASLDERAGEEKPATAAPAEVVPLLGQIHHQISNLLASLPASIAPEVGRLGLVGALQQVAEGELGSCFDGVSWKLDPAAVAMTTRFPGLVGEVVFCAAREALRNAARHGRGGNLARPLHVAVSMARDDGFQVCIEDDGVGLRNAPRSDGGQGLILHSTLLTIIGGTLTAEAARSGGTRVVLLLPPSVCCDAPSRMSAS
jgi:signal transduction histidine kinase